MNIEGFEAGQFRLVAIAGVPMGPSSVRLPILTPAGAEGNDRVIQIRVEGGRYVGTPHPRSWLDREIQDGGALAVPKAPFLHRSLARPTALYAPPAFQKLGLALDSEAMPLPWHRLGVEDLSVTIAEEEEIRLVRQGWLDRSLGEAGKGLMRRLAHGEPTLEAVIKRLEDESAYAAAPDQAFRVNEYLGVALLLSEGRKQEVSVLWEAEAQYNDPGLTLKRFLWKIESLMCILELAARKEPESGKPDDPPVGAPPPPREYDILTEFDAALQAIQDAETLGRKEEICRQLARDARDEYGAEDEDEWSIREKRRSHERVHMSQEDLLKEFGAYLPTYLHVRQVMRSSQTGPRKYTLSMTFWDGFWDQAIGHMMRLPETGPKATSQDDSTKGTLKGARGRSSRTDD